MFIVLLGPFFIENIMMMPLLSQQTNENHKSAVKYWCTHETAGYLLMFS